MSGGWNYTIGVYGKPGSGKSTAALRRLLDLRAEARKLPGWRRAPYLFVFEGDGDFPRRGRDGLRLSFVHDHGSIAACEARLAQTADGIHVVRPRLDEVYCSICESPGRGLGRECSACGAQSERLDGGLAVALLAVRAARLSRGYAVCYFDEIAFVPGAKNGGQFSGWFSSRQAVRRHDRVAWVYSTQCASWPHPDLRKLTNEFRLLRMDDAMDARALRLSSVPPEVLDAQARLQYFEQLVYRK